MNWRRDRSIRVGRRQENMFSNEVIAMAVKKSTAPKTGTKTAKAKPAAKKVAPKKAATKKAAPSCQGSQGWGQEGRAQEGTGHQADRAAEEVPGDRWPPPRKPAWWAPRKRRRCLALCSRRSLSRRGKKNKTGISASTSPSSVRSTLPRREARRRAPSRARPLRPDLVILTT